MPTMANDTSSLIVYLIAGEQSGDLLGARLMRALKAMAESRGIAIEFSGIGGENMRAEGLESLIEIRELALMGFAEILPHIPRLLKHIRRTADDILRQQPDIVVTIDSPGFNFRVTKACRKEWPKDAGGPPFVHYVAPSVWAYRPQRAAKLAALYDAVLTLLPFEPPYFEAEGMEATFVGHPVVETAEEVRQQADPASLRTHHRIPATEPVVAMLPGSRRGEIRRHLPLLHKTALLLADSMPNIHLVMPVVPHLQEEVQQLTANWPLNLTIVNSADQRWDAFACADVALAKSGTVTLELAITQTPTVVFYKVNPISAWLIRRMLRTKWVTLINLLHDKEYIPEFLQEDAQPEHLANAILELLQNRTAKEKQEAAAQQALTMLGMGDALTPSQKAAASLWRILQR